MHDSFVDSVDDSIFHGGGAIAGGQAGCNYQVQQFVVGVEGEGWWSGLKNKGTNNSTTTTIEGLETATDTRTSFVQTQNRWDAAVSLRAGYALDRLLFFGKAGVVFGGFRFSDAFTDTLVLSDALGSFSQSETGSKTLTGMLLGFGLEWAFLDNWLLRFEADYLNFPRTDVPFASSTVCTTVGNLHCGLTTVSQTSTFSEFASKGLLKVGVSYKFY